MIALVIDPYDSTTLYALSRDNGLFKTSDGAASWNEVQTGLLGANSYGVALSIGPGSPATVYLVFGIYNFYQARIASSTDGGATWSDRVSPQGSGCLFIMQFGPIFMTMDPTDPSRLYLGEYTEGSLGLTRSVDGGANWNDIFRLNTDAADGMYAMAIDPTNSDILYLGLEDYNEGGVRKSVDGGATWVGSGLTGSAVTVMTIDPAGSTIYASTEGVHSQPAGFRGLFKSTDGGASWAELSQGLEALRNARIRVTAILTGPPNSHIG